MIWNSWSNFFYMGGYAFYVWGSFLVTLLCIVGELWLLARLKRTLFTQLNQIVRLARQDSHET